LGPNAFFWLLLVPPDVGRTEGELVLPTISFDGTPSWWQTNAGARFLERELPVYMRRCRWYRSKARDIISVNLIDTIDFSPNERTQILVIAVNFSEGARDLYCLPIKLVSGDEARNVEVEYPAAVIAKVGYEGDLLIDAIASETFQAGVLNLMADNTVVAGRSGRLVPAQSKGLHDLLAQGRPTSSRVLKVEQSNSSIIFGEQIYVKLFRKLDEGLNPDLEVTKQLSERCGFQHVPTYLGDIQYLCRGQEPAAVMMAQGFTSSEQDGWSQTLAAVDRYFDRVLKIRLWRPRLM
jgi:maltose alpha-D-glucosyltransferase / alpha-amylase